MVKTYREKYRDQRARGKVVRRAGGGGRRGRGGEGERARGERRVRIMHYSWWLLGLREKGLYSISVFEASTLPPREREGSKEQERESWRDRTSVRSGEGKGGGVAFPEGRSREKAAGGCRNTRGGGGERGSNRVACNFEMDSTPPTTTDRPPSFSSSSYYPPCGFSSFSSTLFLSSHETRGVDQPRSRCT